MAYLASCLSQNTLWYCLILLNLPADYSRKYYGHHAGNFGFPDPNNIFKNNTLSLTDCFFAPPPNKSLERIFLIRISAQCGPCTIRIIHVSNVWDITRHWSAYIFSGNNSHYSISKYCIIASVWSVTYT